jgi:putative SOS response-associated peptidase YedK
MCGRFTITVAATEAAELLGVAIPQDFRPRYNAAPSQNLLATRVNDAGKREAVLLRWGLVPWWAKDVKIGYSLLNARSETLAGKPSFREAFKKRRCVIPADGFFEWQAIEKVKHPHWFHRKDRKAFLFAGLWERWEPASGDPVESCTIITTDANEVVQPYHDRMPVILAGPAIERWLAPGAISPESAAELLKPAPKSFLVENEVSTVVNSPKTDSPQCIEALA